MAIIDGKNEFNAKESIKINISYVYDVYQKIVKTITEYHIELLCNNIIILLNKCTLTLNTIFNSNTKPLGEYIHIINNEKDSYEYYIKNMPVKIQSIKIINNNSIINCIYEEIKFIND